MTGPRQAAMCFRSAAFHSGGSLPRASLSLAAPSRPAILGRVSVGQKVHRTFCFSALQASTSITGGHAASAKGLNIACAASKAATPVQRRPATGCRAPFGSCRLLHDRLVPLEAFGSSPRTFRGIPAATSPDGRGFVTPARCPATPACISYLTSRTSPLEADAREARGRFCG